MKELNELVELAKNATQGDWRRTSTVFNGVTATPFTLEFGKEVVLASCPEKCDALFIAAANPKAILAIAEAFRELEQRAEAAEAKACQDPECHSDFMPLFEEMVKRGKENDALQAQLDGMAKQEPSGFLHTMHMEAQQIQKTLSESERNPYGIRGNDYSPEYYVTTTPVFTRPAPAVSLAEKVAPTVRLKRGLLKHKFDDKWFAVSDCYEISTHYVATLDEDGVSRNYPKHMYEFRAAIVRKIEEAK